jgi:hypothetical protein
VSISYVNSFENQTAMKRCAKCPDSEVFQELIDINEGLLVSLGVSHPSLNRVVEVAATHNIHAKVRAIIASNHLCPHPQQGGRRGRHNTYTMHAKVRDTVAPNQIHPLPQQGG